MAGFEISGLDELQQELEHMRQAVEDLGEERSVSFEELFTEEFMEENTDFTSIDDLLEAGGFHAETNEDFEAIPEDALDAHVAKTTRFDSWEDMLGEATEQYLISQLGF